MSNDQCLAPQRRINWELAFDVCFCVILCLTLFWLVSTIERMNLRVIRIEKTMPDPCGCEEWYKPYPTF